jgi:anti-sigma factor RsiW
MSPTADNADLPSEIDLEGYLDEALPVEQMAAIEARLRAEPDLLRRLAELNRRRDAGVHSVGSIWRRYRVTCPSRSTLSSYLLGALPDEEAAYIRFHLETVGCRVCRANIEDLQHKAAAGADTETQARRRKYFESSAGLLRKK